MQIELLIVGDEILSGKRHDQHFARVVALLRGRGMRLAGAQIVGDDAEPIAAAIRRVHATGNALLSCGGIGATPDDCTRQAAALAFDVPIERHPEALALIEANYGERAHPNRVLMADFPRGAELVPNPVNRVAGFSLGRCYFVPGFPEMAWPMIEWVLDQRLRHLHRSAPPEEYTLRVAGTRGEGDLLGLMQATLARFPGVKLSSLPFRGTGDVSAHIEFGFYGPRAESAAAYRWFVAQLRQPGVEPGVKILPLRPPTD